MSTTAFGCPALLTPVFGPTLTLIVRRKWAGRSRCTAIAPRIVSVSLVRATTLP